MLTFMEKWRIKNSVKNRGITHFTHFTNIENIESILCNGLLTKYFMDGENISYSCNDPYRYDGLENSVSLSVMFPNYKMFFKVRQENPNARWAVILLKAIEILKYDCVFCRTNAANNVVSEVPVFRRKGYAAFDDMFYEREDVTREEMGLPSYFTTDPQAEILVCDNIHQSLIDGIYVEKDEDLSLIRGQQGSICVDKDYFAPRFDYKRW